MIFFWKIALNSPLSLSLFLSLLAMTKLANLSAVILRNSFIRLPTILMHTSMEAEPDLPPWGVEAVPIISDKLSARQPIIIQGGKNSFVKNQKKGGGKF